MTRQKAHTTRSKAHRPAVMLGEWREQARCAAHPNPEIFDEYAPEVARNAAALVCEQCPVRERCLREGVESDSYGTYGGAYLIGGKVASGQPPKPRVPWPSLQPATQDTHPQS